MASGHSDSTLTASEKSSHIHPNPEKSTHGAPAQAADEEQANIPMGGAAAAPDLSLRSSQHKRTAGGRAASLQRSRSYGDEHGFTAFGEDEEAPPKGGNETDPEKEYEVQWDKDDPRNPRCFSKGRKWMIVLIVSAGSTCVTCTSSMYTSTYGQITEEFHISRVVATLGLSLFVMGLGLGPSKFTFRNSFITSFILYATAGQFYRQFGSLDMIHDSFYDLRE